MSSLTSRVASRHLRLTREARMSTKNEVGDKLTAAIALLNGIHLSGDDERIIGKVQRLLDEAIELSEDNGWF